MTGGSYVLKMKIREEVKRTVGSLDVVKFESGWYAYVGSSRSTDFKRVERHKSIDKGEKSTRHWHVDYLLGLDESDLVGSYKVEKDVECLLSNNINLDGVDGFGCSDCGCDSHLYFSDKEVDFDRELEKSFKTLGLDYFFTQD